MWLTDIAGLTHKETMEQMVWPVIACRGAARRNAPTPGPDPTVRSALRDVTQLPGR